VAGSSYNFQPAAADSSGGTLSFSIQNIPSWASFNAATGQLSGTPTGANVGSYSNIIITVSDGTASASLAPFAINVTQIGQGSVTLSWTAPTENTNGTALTNLAGYVVYYGNSPSAMNQSITISSVGVTTYVITNLNPGTWYFEISAYNSANVGSGDSAVVSATI
jgi:putative Ig domain-containing protein